MTPEGKAPKGNMPEKLIIAHSEYWGRVVISEDMIVNHTMQGRTIEHWVHESALLASEEKVKSLEAEVARLNEARSKLHTQYNTIGSSLENRLAEAEEREKKLESALRRIESGQAVREESLNDWQSMYQDLQMAAGRALSLKVVEKE